jgi:hypothetical protein
MSQATQAKSAKARATIMLRLMKTVKALGNCRAFDDCCEMGDGDAVVAHVIVRAYADPDVAALIRRRGLGYWLAPGYLDRMTTTEDHTPIVLQAIALQGRAEAQPQAQAELF